MEGPNPHVIPGTSEGGASDDVENLKQALQRLLHQSRWKFFFGQGGPQGTGFILFFKGQDFLCSFSCQGPPLEEHPQLERGQNFFKKLMITLKSHF